MNQDECKRLFRYESGKLYWKVDRGSNAKAGARAGRKLPTGYRSVQVSGRRYQEHRLVWLMHYGEMPKQIDHINRVKDDNRVENLRECNHSQNQINSPQRPSASGCRGVRINPRNGKFIAAICKNSVEIRIGTFHKLEDAKAAYEERAAELFGEFAISMPD